MLHNNNSEFEDDDSENMFGVVLADGLSQFLAMILLFCVCLLIMSHQENTNKVVVKESGKLCIELSWPERNIDLDTWTKFPGTPYSVGYSNKTSPYFNLLRDVTGFNNNPTHIMLEIQCTTVVKPGEYTFNAYYYKNNEDELEHTQIDDPRKAVEATMVVRYIVPDGQKGVSRDFFGKFPLTFEHQEKTMFDFIIDENMNIVENTINSIDKKIVADGGRGSP